MNQSPRGVLSLSPTEALRTRRGGARISECFPHAAPCFRLGNPKIAITDASRAALALAAVADEARLDPKRVGWGVLGCGEAR